MNSKYIRGMGRKALPRLTLIAGVAVLAACDTDALLQVDEPSFPTPATLNNPAGLPILYAGGLGDFQRAYSGSGGDSYLSVSSLISDELKSSDTFTTRNATDSRSQFPTVQGNTSDVAYSRLQSARRSAAETADAVARLATEGDADPRYAVMKSLEGFAIIGLAEAFCGNIPLGTASGGAPGELGTPLTTAQTFTEAVARFDAALAANPNSNLAKVGKGRALLNNGDYAAAAAAVAGVPTSFVHFIEHSVNTGLQNNPIFSLQDNRRYTMSDDEGGNGLDYITANDPRTPWYMHTELGFDQATPVFRSGRSPDYGSDVVLADGIEARLIEAEAALNSGGAWLPILNALRADVHALMLARYPDADDFEQFENDLAPLADPGTQAARVDMLFRERAFWLYLSGHRHGDLRRLIRQYNRPAESVFPTGAWHKGGNYGPDIVFPIPFNETQNPNYDIDQCIVTQA